ncbi:unnamed protein product [Dracunculus medinensis]|uniref:G-patch domain-containing protein n=1 Tax=Dracunculus medinensis TaxID=318479 RepID=A0A3P7PTR1_DRAME|nr:unnamed protein product [Dracunculus medinensis]
MIFVTVTKQPFHLSSLTVLVLFIIKKDLQIFKIFPSYCNDCQCMYTDVNHKTSTAHLIETKKLINHPGYQIPEWNKGYQLLRKTGWNEYEGLGKDGSGHRYPIRSVLKRDRFGFGLKKQTPKVTHFLPFDKRAIEKVKKKSKRELKEIERRKANRTKQLEIDFRMMFHFDQ